MFSVTAGDCGHTALPDRHFLGVQPGEHGTREDFQCAAPQGLAGEPAARFVNIYHSPVQPAFSDLWPVDTQCLPHQNMQLHPDPEAALAHRRVEAG